MLFCPFCHSICVQQQLPARMVSLGACRESWAGTALLQGLSPGTGRGLLCSEQSSQPCPRSSGEGHCVCRHWRNVLVVLAKLNTRGSSPECFLGFSLQKGGWGRREDKDKFFMWWTQVIQSSAWKLGNINPSLFPSHTGKQSKLCMLLYLYFDVSRHAQTSG